ncbi:unnamed protein product [Withania somnifera]
MEISQGWSKFSPGGCSPPFDISLPLETSQGERRHLLAAEINENGLKGEAETKIQVRGLNKVSDKGDSTLNSVSVDIPGGVIMGVIGPTLNRLWEPPKNTLFLDGTDICDVDVLSLLRKVGMLFQLPVLFEGTVADNIRYGPKLKGKKLSDNEVYKLLTLADLDSSFFNKSGGELSVGQAQRVALARTLANEPGINEIQIRLHIFCKLKETLVLLLDEPTSALDPTSIQNVEHSSKQRIADAVCLLVDEQIVEIIKPDQLSKAKHPMALRFLQLSS